MPTVRCIVVLVALFAAALAGCGDGQDRGRVALYGFNDNAVAQGVIGPDADAQLTRRAGANAVRVTVDWRGVEPSPGRYDFTLYDRIDRAMRARGVAPVWIPLLAPRWAAGAACAPSPAPCQAPPDAQHDAAWRAFVAQIARRYPHSAGIEVWNEPNYVAFWAPRPDPVRYAQLLREAHDAIKAVAPRVPVILGGIGNKPIQPGSQDVPLADFLRVVLQHGGGGAIDAIGFHAYPLGADERPVAETFRQVRGLRARFGLDRLPLWVTETGVSTTGPIPQLKVAPRDQATELVHLYRQISAMHDVHALFIHTLIEPPGTPADLETGYGVVAQDLRPKPAFAPLAAARRG